MANDFSGDADCVALWKLDNNAQDSKGGNDLTEVNSPSYDGADKKEGTHCIDLEKDSSQYCTIDDADLDAGFPGKSGTSEQSFSICLWFKAESTSQQGLVTKYMFASGKRSFGVINYANQLRFYLGYNNGNNYTNLNFGTDITNGVWYHIAVTYDASDNGMKIRVWDDDAQALLDDNATTTAGGDMSPGTAPLDISRWNEAGYQVDGKIDEVVIFKDVLTDDEIDQIRAGTYSVATEKTSSDAGSGVDAVDSLQTPEAKSSSDAGSGVEGTPLSSATLAGSETGSGIEALITRLLAAFDTGTGTEAGGLQYDKDLLATETAEGSDCLTAKIEIPTKGGGMKLWT